MKVIYFAHLRELIGVGEERVDLGGRTTLGAFVNGHLAPRLKGVDTGRLLYAVNEELAKTDCPITDDDTLAVFPPFSGG